jgi:hypothetical protein
MLAAKISGFRLHAFELEACALEGVQVSDSAFLPLTPDTRHLKPKETFSIFI